MQTPQFSNQGPSVNGSHLNCWTTFLITPFPTLCVQAGQPPFWRIPTSMPFFPAPLHLPLLCCPVFFFFICLLLERGREGGREGEKHQCLFASHALLTGNLVNNQTCALTANQRGDPLVCRPGFRPKNHTSQGSSAIFNLSFKLSYISAPSSVKFSLSTVACRSFCHF